MLENVKEMLNNEKYDFLRNKEIADNAIFLGISGSYGYGTNNENSDIDLRGVMVESEEVLFKLSSFEQFECRETDTVIYGLKKFITLALNSNPQILELFGLNKENIYYISNEGKLLYDNGNIFLSKKVIKTFGNYAMAQLKRIENALCHDSYTEEKKASHLLKSMETDIQNYNRKANGGISIYIGEDSRELLVKGNFKDVPIKEFINLNSAMNNISNSYIKLNGRNNKKEEIKLYKHAMHLVRLLLTGKYILEGRGIVTRLDEHIATFMEIRNGKYSFEEIFEMVNKYSDEFRYAAKETVLKDEPDTKMAEEIMFEIYKKKIIRRI